MGQKLDHKDMQEFFKGMEQERKYLLINFLKELGKEFTESDMHLFNIAWENGKLFMFHMIEKLKDDECD